MPDIPRVPVTPITPSTPVAGQSQQDILSQQQWEQSKLYKMMQAQQDEMQKIANKAPYRHIYYKTIRKGALVAFEYKEWKHDPYPLILCSSIYHDQRVAGVNLHYLTFKYIKELVKMYCGKAFHYQLIKGNNYIRNAFRTYKKDGIRAARLLDCDYLMTILGASRSYKPSEVEAIRKFIQEQLRKHLNPTAEELADMVKQYEGMILNDPSGWRYEQFRNQIGKLWGKLPQPPHPREPYGKPTRDIGTRIPKDITGVE